MLDFVKKKILGMPPETENNIPKMAGVLKVNVLEAYTELS